MIFSPLRDKASRQTTLLTERLRLRSPIASDWASWAEVRRQSKTFLQPWEPTWPPDSLSRGSFRRRIEQTEREARDGSARSFLLLLRDTDTVVGGLTISHIRRGVSQTASLGYWLGEVHTGQGFMTEALRAALPFAFTELKLHRIEAACLPKNDASKRLLERLGFQEEGRARGYLKIDGRWQDHVLFGLLEEEWLAGEERAQSAESGSSSLLAEA